jgi:uncharacterized protein YjbI with pentapeptide repeats
MTQDELKTILADHAAWLMDNSKGKRASLRYVDLLCANLRNANLRGADLSYSDLRFTYLAGADLTGATILNGWKLTK